MLFDLYGELLTDKQKEFFDLYYNEDLSLSEIAENEGITRQGVRDAIVRAENILRETEDKLGHLRKFGGLQAALESINEAALEIRRINADSYFSTPIDDRIRTIIEKTRDLSEAISEGTE